VKIGIFFLSISILALAGKTLSCPAPLIKEISYGGKGCSKNAEGAKIKASFQDIDVVFKNFKVGHSVSLKKRLHRKSCQIVVSLDVPKGYHVSFGDLNLKGEKNVVKGSSLDFRMEAFFSGDTEAKLQKKWDSGSKDPFKLEYKGAHKSWSSCGQDVNVRFSLSLMLRSKKVKGKIPPAFGQLRSLKGKNWLLVKPCS